MRNIVKGRSNKFISFLLLSSRNRCLSHLLVFENTKGQNAVRSAVKKGSNRFSFFDFSLEGFVFYCLLCMYAEKQDVVRKAKRGGGNRLSFFGFPLGGVVCLAISCV